MHVVATAGHVDHGKSTLVRALTGQEPDRWAEERRRGMTIDLGFAWTTLPSGATLAFVDVPGHERFVPNMLAGVGPVPAALIVVAADEGWMPQSAEHLAALHALGVRHALVAVSRADLADPGPAAARARAEIAPTSLGDVETVPVSGATGVGLDDLRAALDRLVARLRPPSVDAPIRLWIDRSFTVRGAGTVVTGTLGAGRLRAGDEVELSGQRRPLRVRGLQSLGEPAGEVTAVARVAVNLRGIGPEAAGRGAALLTPGRFRLADLIDVRVRGDPVADLPAALTLHLGSAAVPVRVRPLGADTARLRLARPLPVRLGDRALLRDPGRRHVSGGVTVLDVAPLALRRRGAAAARAADLSTMDGQADLRGELRRRLLARRADLAAMGVPDDPAAGVPAAGEWLADPEHWAALGTRLSAEVDRYAREHPLEPGAPVEALRHRLGLPDRSLVEALAGSPLRVHGGRVSAGHADTPPELAGLVARAFDGLAGRPFAAPEAHRLAEVGLGAREQAAAERAGLLHRLAENVVLPPGAAERAVAALADVPQPFTLSAARRAWDTSRRVAVPLLQLLDRRGVTRRLPDDRRVLTERSEQ
ncbi:selenocysteine-specific translation elongation factor [Mangrovihabitans endophyticus]|uniref:Selenocysteine-specific elongation factor n=1 Tax=Mangrovihabitans endophyticus TaxID=1751298 RepID=A0A8J3FR90_9ACTN|nr:selenocysteine-specific translation elongation factor [Mangrovihabitans endophyticus]GGL07617.1 selenocysteine-specific translation elongation factor [Mangrovihabitans endophyticus]